MLLASKQNYNDAFIVKKNVILSVQKHLIPEILSQKIMVKPFSHDLKRKMKNTCSPMPTGNEFKNASDARDNIVTNARTL